METRAQDERAHPRRLARSTAIFSAASGLSRVLGLVREIVAANYFGARGPINAFTVAFQIPNLVRALVADAALSSAFVPVFSELLEKGERARAWRVASTVFWLFLLVVGSLTALFILAAPLLMPPLTNAYDDLTVTLSQILFPIVVLIGLFGIVTGILNSYDQFTIPALTPVFWNLAIIIGLVVGVPQADTDESKLYIYAGSIVVGTLIQFLLPLPWLRGLDGRLRLAFDWRDPAVRQVFKLMGPVMLGLGLINVNAVIGTFVAAKWIDPTIAPNAIDKAFRVYMLPQGMFSVAVATILFPSLARLAARGDIDGFRDTVTRGLRQINFLLLPAAAASIVLAEPIIRLLYERGAFDPEETTVVAQCLAAFSIGLTFNGMMLMLNRGFFSLQRPWTPTVIALVNLVLNVVLYAAFERFGAWGIPLAISLANIAGVVLLALTLRARVGSLHLLGTTRAFVRVLIASAVLAAVSYGVWWLLDDALGRSFPGQLASVSSALVAGGLAYLGAARLLRVHELAALLSLRSRSGGD
ncbi:MAG: murein biosynthesis integral membrane protein MurJ [Thermoleophilia bacterium]|nr:murein biosynthesis integral membrane protein MurJ [Thermoleophilia bacterium]